MACRRPLSLTDEQLAQIQQAAASLPLLDRSDFLRGVARHLGSEPSDAAVTAAIEAELQLNRIPVFLQQRRTAT